MIELLTIFLASIFGIMVSLFLRRVRIGDHSRKHKSCPPYYDCHLVLQSRYATLFGLPIELIGVGYYSLVFSLYFFQFAFPQLQHPLISLGLIALSGTALLFTIYLFFLQFSVLKKMCYWCASSVLFCLAIFVSAIMFSPVSVIVLFAEYKLLLVILHLLGFALGVGGATMTDLFFFKFLRDFKISTWESKVLHEVSHLIWIGLIILIVSGVALYLPDMEALNTSSKFIAKVIVVGVALVNGIFLNLFISPKMIHISFGDEHVKYPGQLKKLRKIAFASGAVSIVSWYTAFILGAVPKSQPLTLLQIMTIYIACIALAVLGSQLVEQLLKHKARRR